MRNTATAAQRCFMGDIPQTVLRITPKVEEFPASSVGSADVQFSRAKGILKSCGHLLRSRFGSGPIGYRCRNQKWRAGRRVVPSKFEPDFKETSDRHSCCSSANGN